MPFRTFVRSLLFSVALGVMPTVTLASAGVDEPKPSGTQAPERVTKQIVLHASSPMEIASIIQSTTGVDATGSERSGVVILMGPQSAIDRATEQISLLESAARNRIDELAKRKMAEQEERREADRRAIEERQRISDIASITIEFSGGTLGEYLAAVRKASGFDNIVVGDPRVVKLQMPAVKVKRVTGAAAVMLLQSLRFAADGHSVALSVQMVPGDPEGVGIEADPVMVIDLADAGDSRAVSPPLQTEIFDLAVYQKVEPDRLKALLDAITMAATMNGRSESFQLKLHEGTGLLVARGTNGDLELVLRTIKAFTGQARNGSATARPESTPSDKQ